MNCVLLHGLVAPLPVARFPRRLQLVSDCLIVNDRLQLSVESVLWNQLSDCDLAEPKKGNADPNSQF